MRTCERIGLVAAVALALFCAVGAAQAFEGAGSSSKKDQPSPDQAFEIGRRAYMAGDKAAAVGPLLDAASRGYVKAQWQLARMYAEGDGVDRDDVKAFDYFSQIYNANPNDDEIGPMQKPFVAKSIVALGNYYLDGIPNSPINRDAVRARAMFDYASKMFGDPDAQYNLARMYLDGTGGPKDPWQAARWLGHAANKGQREAQAVLGHMLFNGLQIRKEPARGLMWLSLANAAAGPNDKWIRDLYAEANGAATPEIKSAANGYVEAWNKDRN